MTGRNDGGDVVFPPDPLPEDIAVIAARYATYGASTYTYCGDIQTLLRYIEVLEDRIDKQESA